MSISSTTRSYLNELLLAVLRDADVIPSWEQIDLLTSRWGRIPDDLLGEAGDRDMVILSGNTLADYNEALSRVVREPEFRELAVGDMDSELWRLVCEVTVRSSQYKTEQSRARAIARVLAALRRPIQSYEVMCAIEHLKLAGSGIVVRNVTIRNLTKERVKAWLGESELAADLGDRFLNKSVAIAEVGAGSPARAMEHGYDDIDDALNLLRYGTVVTGGAADEIMLFCRGDAMAVKSVGSGRIEAIALKRPFSAIDWTADWARVQLLRKAVGRVERAFEGREPNRLALRLSRATHWIGSSITKDHHDDKIVDLCTALEALLTSRSDGLKGEAVAVRSMLLPLAIGQGAPPGGLVYDLYDIRSQIVHGSSIRVAGKGAYQHLLWIACVVATHFADTVTTRTELRSFSDMLAVIQQPGPVAQATRTLQLEASPHTERLVNYAATLVAAGHANQTRAP